MPSRPDGGPSSRTSTLRSTTSTPTSSSRRSTHASRHAEPPRTTPRRAGRRAVELAEATDAPNLRARAAVCLAEVLRARGDEEEANEYARRALADYEAKGNVVDAAAVRERLREGAATEA